MREKQVQVRQDKYISLLDNEKFEKKAIIFLHGLTGNKYQLQFFFEHFYKDYRCIAVDFRGRGDSSPAEDSSSLLEHKQDIINLIEELKLEKPIIAGYSMGGFVAAHVASEVELEKLILLDGAATMSDHQDSIVVPTFGRLTNTYESDSNYVETVVGNYSKMGVPDSEKLRKAVNYEIEQVGDSWRNKADAETIKSDWFSFHDFDIKALSKTIEAPSLLIQCLGSVGSLGPLFMPENYVETKESLKELEVFESESNHYTLVFDKQEEVIDKIEEFLDKE